MIRKKIFKINFFLSYFLCFSSFLYAQLELRNYSSIANNEPHIKAAANFVDLGNKSFENGSFKEAQDQYFRALIYDPTYAEAHFGLAKSYLKLNLINDAIREYNSTINFDAGFSDAYIQLADIYLKQNKAATAFEIYFKAISFNPLFSITNPKNVKITPRRKKEVEDLQLIVKESGLKDKRVYIYSDVDIAETLLFSRYLDILSQLGAKVLFEPPRVLESIYKTSFDSIEIIDWLTLQEDISYDLKAPLGALPFIFGTIKDQLKTLEAPKKDIEQFQGWIAKDTKTIGIAWKPQGQLSFFSDLPKDINVYSLQSQSSSLDISELIDDFDALSNLAGAISHLDLVISFNNTIAILSASLGKPTWLILGASSEWMWQGSSNISPWFSNLRIFHLPKAQDIILELKK
jgi:tetratricopeptide (TPR) repeat protein